VKIPFEVLLISYITVKKFSINGWHAAKRSPAVVLQGSISNVFPIPCTETSNKCLPSLLFSSEGLGESQRENRVHAAMFARASSRVSDFFKHCGDLNLSLRRLIKS